VDDDRSQDSDISFSSTTSAVSDEDMLEEVSRK